MEASYRIVSQADGTFAIERTEPGKEPVITGHYKTEEEARHHIAEAGALDRLTRPATHERFPSDHAARAEATGPRFRQ